MTPRISVRPETLSALADELASLAAALAEDGDRCRATAGALDAALGGPEGAAAGAVAGALAEGTEAVAGTLRSAAAAYRGADEALARRIGPP